MERSSLSLCNAFSLRFNYSDLKPTDDIFIKAWHYAMKRTILRLEKSINEEGLIKEPLGLELDMSNKITLTVGSSSTLVHSIAELWKELGELLQSCSTEKLVLADTGKEIINSFENGLLAELYKWLIWIKFPSDSLWRSIRECRKDPCDEALFWEQLGSFEGHPLHPCAKTKILSSGDIFPAKSFLATGTEFGVIIPLRVVAVRTSKMTLFPSPEGFNARINELYPKIVSRCQAELKSLNANVEEYTFIFVHPANVSKLISYQPLLDPHTIILLESTFDGRPTLSYRTIVPLECAEIPHPHVKLPVPLQMTSLIRYVSPVEISGSHLLTVALRKIFNEDPILQKLPLTVLGEEFGAHLSFGKDMGITYEQARFCSMLFRDSPQITLKAYETDAIPPVVIAALVTKTSVGSKPCTLIEEICDFYNIILSDWFRHWVKVCMSQLELFLRTGIALEAHQQNGLALLDPVTGFPVKLICRETGGGIIWDSGAIGMMEAGRWFRSRAYKRDDVIRDIDVACNYVSHSLLRSNFGGFWRVHPELRSETGFVFKEMSNTFDRVKTNMSAHWLTSRKDTSISDDLLEFWMCFLEKVKARVFSPVMDRKSLLLMRLRRSKDEMYVKSTSPIFSEEEGKNEFLRE